MSANQNRRGLQSLGRIFGSHSKNPQHEITAKMQDSDLGETKWMLDILCYFDAAIEYGVKRTCLIGYRFSLRGLDLISLISSNLASRIVCGGSFYKPSLKNERVIILS